MKKTATLAFDYGTQKIGVAIGTLSRRSAEPLTILSARDGIPQWHQIEALIKEWQPAELLVGLPLNMDGSASELSRRAEKFSRRLEGRFGLKTHTFDERLSSREARETASLMGKEANEPIDDIAASLILRGWFDEQDDVS